MSPAILNIILGGMFVLVVVAFALKQSESQRERIMWFVAGLVTFLGMALMTLFPPLVGVLFHWRTLVGLVAVAIVVYIVRNYEWVSNNKK